MKNKVSYFLIIALCFTLFSFGVQAATSTSLSLTNTSGDAVEVNITGKVSSSIRLSFLPAGATSLTTIILGSTDVEGNFSTSISSGGYGIPSGSPAYATIDGVQSVMILWPNYSSTISLNQTDVQIAVDQSVTINSSNTLILAANSLITSIGTAISGSQLTVTGLELGTGTLTLCAVNAGCDSIAVTVGATSGQTQITINENNIDLSYRDSKNLTLFGNGDDGYVIESNSGPSVVSASIAGTTDVISLFGGDSGTATIKICAAGSTSNCLNLYVDVSKAEVNNLAFSQNNLTLIPGLTQNITVSGDTENNYYVSSNTDSSVATASISGATLAVTGGTTTGTTVVTVCSATINNTCSDLSVQTNADTTTPSATVIAFSQNVVSVNKNSTTNVTVSGGGSSGYSVSSNSEPEIATASITGGSNIISILGNEEGSTIVEVCSSATEAVCASIYVNVEPELVPVKFSSDNAALMPEQKVTITISGGTDNNVIYSVSNPNAVSANLTNNGYTLVLTGETVAGTSIIRVCDSSDADNCSDLTATLNVSATTPTDTSTDTTTDTSDDTTSTPTSATEQLKQILADAATVFSGNVNSILARIAGARNQNREKTNKGKYINSLIADARDIVDETINRMNLFITYGTKSTKILGEGERAGVIGSYKKAFGRLPKTESQWQDATKIANGRWPSEVSEDAINIGKVEFKKVYLRDANMDNPNDNAAVSVIAYGLRPANRNLDSEKVAIKSFKYIYGHNPVSSLAWDIVRAIAYSGATR